MVVLLDVDGVLHPTRGPQFFEPRCLAALRSIIEATGAVASEAAPAAAVALPKCECESVRARLLPVIQCPHKSTVYSGSS